MNMYLLLPLIQTIFCLTLMALVIKGNFRKFTHRLFSLFLLGLAIWGVLIFGMRASPDIEYAFLWDRPLITLAQFMSVIFYQFSIHYTGTRIKSWIIPSLYLFCLVFIPLTIAGFVFSGMQIKPYGYAPVFGPLVIPHMVFSYGLILIALWNFIKFYRNCAYAELKNRSIYIIIGIISFMIGGALDVLPILGLPLYPGFIIGNIIFCLLTTVAIVKHNLLDIRVVLRKGIAYVLTSAMIVIPFIAIFLLATKVFTEGDFPSWAYFAIAIVLVFVLPHLWQWVQRWVDRLFYRDRYDYLKALETFSQQTQSLTDSARLGSTMVNLLAKALRSSNVYLLQPLPSSNDFTQTSTNDMNNPTPVIRLKNGGALVKWLERSNSMLLYEDIEIVPRLQAITSKEKETLERLEADLISPLKAPTGQLSGILILGKKFSEQPYTSEDRQLIYTICNQMSTNLENARLYNESRQEVKERRRAEEKLKESEHFSSSLLANSPNPIIVINPDTSIKYVNPALEKLTGFSLSELIGRKAPYPYWAEETIKKTTGDLEMGMRRKAVRVEELYRNKSGEQFWAEITSAPISKNGEFKYLLANWVDITERKQAEEKERELQRELYLSSRLASIGELAAGVAHQLNNPLTGVLGFSQRLLRKSTDEEASQDLKRIYTETERAAKIVQNLLTFARRREAKKEYSNVNNIVQGALELRAYELKTSNIDVITNLDPSLPKIMLDFHQIQEVFLNIILNAEQAMTEANGGGKLIIKTEKKNGYTRTTFTDDGPGILSENLDNVLDPFFTTKGEKGGTGLGLSVCHGIISEHGGKIYARSKPGKGATFFVELPIIAEE